MVHFVDLDDEDEDDTCDVHDPAPSQSNADDMTCPKCLKAINKLDIVHPVVATFNGTSNLLVYFHDACHKACSSKEVSSIVRGVKYDLMLSTAFDDDIGSC